LLERAPDLPAVERSHVVAALRPEAEELSLLVDEVVGLASGDLATGEPEADFDFATIVTDAVDRFPRRGLDRVGRTDCARVGRNARPRASRNLLGNAHKFNPPDVPIDVRLVDRWVRVRDDGPASFTPTSTRSSTASIDPIPPAHRPAPGWVWRSCGQVAEQHGGSVSAANIGGGRLTSRSTSVARGLHSCRDRPNAGASR
jgi:two-component system, OmpR family, sensor histidine kinase MprB